MSTLIRTVLKSVSGSLLAPFHLTFFLEISPLGPLSLSPHFGRIPTFVFMHYVELLHLPDLGEWPCVVGVL